MKTSYRDSGSTDWNVIRTGPISARIEVAGMRIDVVEMIGAAAGQDGWAALTINPIDQEFISELDVAEFAYGTHQVRIAIKGVKP